jgi:hypothetical protein
VSMKNAVFWDVTLCRSCVNRHFGGTYRFHVHSPPPPCSYIAIFDCWLSLQPPAHARYSLADFSTLKTEAVLSSEKSVHTRPTQRRIKEDGIFQYKPDSLLLYISIYIFDTFSSKLLECNNFRTVSSIKVGVSNWRPRGNLMWLRKKN